jgi:hypothetical protein
MRIKGIIHQQICQLRWHLLACLGLIMVLPLEEALVSLRAGDGFFSGNTAFAAILMGPLLAGLIACANVQGDFDEKWYIFWRSKPADIKLLITIKFFIGLIVSLLVIACPVVFHLVTNLIARNQGNIDKNFSKFYVPVPILIAIMTYSLCFACNVVVRKTARAWLIGMLIGCFLLVLPFMLPLDFKDYMHDIIFWSRGAFLAILLITPAAAFVSAIYAAKSDWQLKTNLKVMLWTVAGLAFALLMLFSSQVANIKVLDEKDIEFPLGRRTLNYAENRVIFHGDSFGYIESGKKSISLREIGPGNPRGYIYDNVGIDSAGRRIHYGPNASGYGEEIYPRHGRLLYKGAENDIFSFSVHVYYRDEYKGTSKKRFYEKVYLRSYQYTEINWMPVFELDISECLTGNINVIRLAMRIIDSKLIACVNNSVVVLDIANPEELRIIEKKLDVLNQYRPFRHRQSKETFTIPLIPIGGIESEERIKLSIDLNYEFHYGSNDIYESSIVDVHDGRFSFFFVDDLDVARFDVVRWDEEKMYCKFGSERPFTILESITGTPRYYDRFVKNGKLYCYHDHTLLVFDTRSKRGIRKLGHFVRMNYRIEDAAVLEDGNIILCTRLDQEAGLKATNQHNWYWYLNLLENPE